MTLLDAQEYDPEKERKRKKRIISAIAFVVIFLCIGWWFRYWPEERVAGRFFDALQKQDYETAYGIWMQDPQWKQHPQQHPKYLFNDFYRNWGPGGGWGLIKTQKVYASRNCPGGGTGIFVEISPNTPTPITQFSHQKTEQTPH